jgi:hypothetical protein
MKKISLLTLLLIAPPVFSADPTGFTFLRVPVGARPAAMGASFLSVSRDVHAIYYNPAGTADLQARAGAVGYLNHILDVQSFFGAYAHPHARGSFGFAINYTDYGDFTRTDELGEEKGAFSANTVVAYLSYSHVPAEKLLLGANIKLIRSQLDKYSADAYALDLGVIYHSSILSNVTFAGGIFNLGKARSAYIQTKESLPLNFQAGISKRLTHLPLLYSLTLIYYEGDDLQFRAGGEFTLTNELYLRLGYDTVGSDQKVGTDSDRFAGVSLGLGFKIKDYMLDYSLSSFGEVGSLNRLSFSVAF